MHILVFPVSLLVKFYHMVKKYTEPTSFFIFFIEACAHVKYVFQLYRHHHVSIHNAKLTT